MELIDVEICYALPAEQCLVAVRLPKGSTVIKAIMASGLLERFPELKLVQVGIFSKKVGLSCIVQAGDRVEIYRPLTLTPNQARLLRAKKQNKKSLAIKGS
jgi:putative ubiquitin-RnfH superfamily antitoxin RatB of RatAB toxin-antitoxin module